MGEKLGILGVVPAEPIWISLKGKRPPRRRTIDDAIFVRFPSIFRALARLTFQLPRRSAFRQALIRRAVLQGQGAWMRGDFEQASMRYAPDAVLTGDMRLDFEPEYHGPDGVRAFVRTYQDAFGESSYEPQWIVDLGGDILVMLLHHTIRGRASGVEVEQVSGHRLEFHNGLVAKEEVRTASGHDWESLADKVGLDPQDLVRRQAA
jgi:hypothetical protein